MLLLFWGTGKLGRRVTDVVTITQLNTAAKQLRRLATARIDGCYRLEVLPVTFTHYNSHFGNPSSNIAVPFFARVVTVGPSEQFPGHNLLTS